MVTEQENKIRNLFSEETGEKAYIGHINDGDKVIWKDGYVKWLENKVIKGVVMCRVGDLVKEVGGDWIKVLKVEGRNIYLDYDDGLNCLDVDDVFAWKHGT